MSPRREAGLHPLSVLLFAVTACAMALAFTNPLYLLGLLAAVVIASAGAGALRALGRTLAFMVPLLLLVVLFNCLFCGEGATVLLNLPWGGGRPVTLEALLYGMTMALKLGLIVSIFCVYNEVQEMDAVFSYFSRFAFRSLFIVITATLMVPRMRRDLARIGAVMRKRGARLSSGPPLSRLRAAYPLVKVLLRSSLEGSMSSAESMHCRAFGAGPRSVYRRHGIKNMDRIAICSLLFSLAGFAAAMFEGRGTTVFYPTLGRVFGPSDSVFLVWILSGLVVASRGAEARTQWKYTLSGM